VLGGIVLAGLTGLRLVRPDWFARLVTVPARCRWRWCRYRWHWQSVHLATFAEPGPDGLVFVGPKGGRLRRSNFCRIWTKARNSIGLPDLHFHDLRHTGNNMAAGHGASLRELMERMGHSSARAALIYQHATRERDEAIAAGMGKLLTQARRQAQAGGGSGTQRARGRRRVS
jgi:integrase